MCERGCLFAKSESSLSPTTPSVRSIGLHRSYRTPIGSYRQFALSAVVLALTEAALIHWAGPLERFLTGFATGWLVRLGTPVTLGSDDFLGLSLSTISYAMPTHDFVELLVWIGSGLAGIAILTFGKFLSTPLRYFVILNLAVISSEAIYLLFQGHLAYSPAQFSVLVMRTMVVTWFVIPAFVATVVVLFPFRAWHIVAAILFCTGYDIALGIARYAAFVTILSHTGPILMADLYLIFGPLLDVIPLIGIFSFFLTRLSRRLERRPGAWQWL